jgi:hypothetical protein
MAVAAACFGFGLAFGLGVVAVEGDPIWLRRTAAAEGF